MDLPNSKNVVLHQKQGISVKTNVCTLCASNSVFSLFCAHLTFTACEFTSSDILSDSRKAAVSSFPCLKLCEQVQCMKELFQK